MPNHVLTPDQLAKVDEKLKIYMADKQSWVDRYGADAEKVMRGRAINAVKRETEKMNKLKLKELVKKSLTNEADTNIMADFESKLKSHNWYYGNDDTDAQTVYKKGSAENAELKKIAKQLVTAGKSKEAANLYNKYNKLDKISFEDFIKSPQPFNYKRKEMELKEMNTNLNEDWGSSDQYAMNQSIHKDLGNPTTFPSPFDPNFESAVENAVDFYWDEWPEYKTDREGLIDYAKKTYYRSFFPKEFQGFMEMFSENLNEDIDLGHQDNEPHMVKGELYQIGKYAMDLYAILEELEEKGGEYDFPAWWQSKITTAKNMMSSAKHYLDFELKEPQIDAAVDALTGEEYHEGEPELEEKKLTAAEKKKKEEIVKGMKDTFKGPKAAMYAIATEKAKKVAETLAKKLKENNGADLKKGDTVEYEGKKYKIGSFDEEANLVYLNDLDGKPAEDSKGSYLKVHKTKVK